MDIYDPTEASRGVVLDHAFFVHTVVKSRPHKMLYLENERSNQGYNDYAGSIR